jgi:hypothetical protein
MCSPARGKGFDSKEKRGARERVGFTRRSRFSRPVDESRRQACIQPMAVRRPWQRFEVARYTNAPGSGKNGGRDQYSVWALPGQSLLSDYLRIPSLPITSR